MNKNKSKLANMIDNIRPGMIESKILTDESIKQELVTIPRSHFEYMMKQLNNSLIGVSLETKKSRLKSRIDLALSAEQLTEVLQDELILSDIIANYGDDSERD